MIGMVGEGRLGPLFKAEQVNIGRLVALKILNVPDAEWARRYLQAVYVSGQLVHSNIVLIFDIGQEEALAYVVREYVEGRSVQERLANREPSPLAEAHGIISQVVYALQHAAENHIFHGSLSPRKILLGPRGGVKVSGFGLRLRPRPRRALRATTGTPCPTPRRNGCAAANPRTSPGTYTRWWRFSITCSAAIRLSAAARARRIEQRILNGLPKPLKEFVPRHPRRRAEDH